MTRLLRIALIALALVIVSGAVLGAWLLRDPNRFKAQLEAAILRQTGLEVDIGGDIGWRLWPPLALHADALSTRHQGRDWHIRRLDLALNPTDLLADPSDWVIEAVTFDQVTMRQQEARLQIQQARVSGLALDRPVPVQARLTYRAGPEAEPLDLTLQGQLLVERDRPAISIQDTRFETRAAAGTCDATAWPLAGLPVAARRDGELVPPALLVNASWRGQCRLARLSAGGETISDLVLDFDNAAGAGRATLDAAEFLGGRARAELTVDARHSPMRWTLTPKLDDVDQQRLAHLLDSEPLWDGPLSLTGSLSAAGNRRDALLETLTGEVRFDGGQGSIDIRAVRRDLIAAAEMLGDGERIRAWPEIWEYRTLAGTWHADGPRHRLNAALDNLTVNGAGTYQPGTDQLSARVDLTVHDAPAGGFDVNPLLHDLPIPLRCDGAPGDLGCRVDEAAARQVAAAALGDDGSALRSRLEQRIDESVPEQYRDAARALLDLLGNSLQQDAEPR